MVRLIVSRAYCPDQSDMLGERSQCRKQGKRLKPPPCTGVIIGCEQGIEQASLCDFGDIRIIL
ncbi:hypothetical protein D3C79_1107700 [compost metagenome]